MNSLGKELNSSGRGIDLGNANISALFFADDLVLVGKSRSDLDELMTITRKYCANHRLGISEKKSKLMSHDAITGKTTFEGSTKFSPLTLDQVLAFKYLGVPLSCSPRRLFKSYNEQVTKRAQNYLSSVLSLVKTGPDRSELAYTLWTCCALPSILYGAEIMPLTQNTIAEVEKCQAAVGKFMLQIPRSSANVSSFIDAGLRPIWSVIAEKVLLYARKTMAKPLSNWSKLAMNENISLGSASPYTKYLLKWKAATDTFNAPPKLIKSAVKRAAIIDVLDQQRSTSITTFAMNGPGNSSTNAWFKPKGWVSDSGFSKIIAQFRSCNSGLGNRGPTKDGQFFKLCPLCAKDEVTALNNEVILTLMLFTSTIKFYSQVHMLLDCPRMSPYRSSCGLGPFLVAYSCMIPRFSSVKIFALYLNDKDPKTMKQKALDLYHMKLGWHKLMGIEM